MGVVFETDLPAEVPTALPVLGLADPDPFPAALARLVAFATSSGLGTNDGPTELRLLDPWTTYRLGGHEFAIHSRSGAITTRRMDRPAEADVFDLADDAAVGIAVDLVARAGWSDRE